MTTGQFYSPSTSIDSRFDFDRRGKGGVHLKLWVNHSSGHALQV